MTTERPQYRLRWRGKDGKLRYRYINQPETAGAVAGMMLASGEAREIQAKQWWQSPPKEDA